MTERIALTVAGNARAYLAPFSAGTAYFVEAAGELILVDCGLGTQQGIARAATGKRVPSAVVLTHLHYDHIGDFPPLAKILLKGTPVFAPPGAREALDQLAKAYQFAGPFDLPGPLHEAGPRATLLGGVTLRFAPAQHGVPAVAVSIEAGGRRLVIAGDGAPAKPLADLAHGADLLVLHTLLPRVDRGSEHERVHTTGESAGRLAREAQVARLLLSHMFYRTDPEELRAAAAAAFPHVEVAETGRTYTV